MWITAHPSPNAGLAKTTATALLPGVTSEKRGRGGARHAYESRCAMRLMLV
ncbi:hypothetical protein SARI_03046 [Salmonella enterica subsp. arizonae serovar 62:z4,z23:-]|uniref:Uncharacterized protein n=1 Tax=Salmonella arizonae (strain ATCC BAA-731 / CDC346-86 / RSK2980) TaxID=41514 RepID=A9MRY5_SALAR|nr:hypothetical protein SARI_03046 [Salmonella enterica subsp. arizonae serovar 62:z4,z23:-]